MKRFLVTGATGLLGSTTVRRLVELGHTVIGYDLAPNPSSLGEVAADVPVIQGDVTDLPGLLDVIRRHRVERVVHFAALLRGTRPMASLQVNCVGTANIFEAAMALNLERACWASSAAVYGRRSQYPDGQRLDEDALVGPRDAYRASKVASEVVASIYRDQGLDVIGVRPVSSYGIGRTAGPGVAQLNAAVRAGALGRPAVFPACFGSLDERWQPMYSEDVAATFVAAATVPRTEHAIFNPPVRQTLTIQESVDILQALVPDVQVTFQTDAPPDASSDLPLVDGSRAEVELQVEQKWDLAAGFADMIEQHRRRGPSPVPPTG